ncbi:hypothetical protein [Streptomyces sp. NBC_01294]|uniref:hypothetical protein n=1 Tax=Streptomyces sp. NBC_01294 TaxID=2903815 RepID=UPI002DD9E978|nr:hypothetical protein [Streptomyces sp. NBC_01294]WRZ59005.1 hypothetical protein OG534_22455 [Streptomyces sp. NBC_01294]
MRSAISGDDRGGRRKRGLVRRVLVGLVVAGVTVACGPAEGERPAVSLPPVASSAVPSQTSADPSPSPSPTPSPSVSPSALPSPSVTTADPKPPATQAPKPATRPATKPAAPPTTKAPTRPATTECEIVSNAGNCYNAGQFCRKADLGRSTHAGNGRLIHCRLDGSQPRWQY